MPVIELLTNQGAKSFEVGGGDGSPGNPFRQTSDIIGMPAAGNEGSPAGVVGIKVHGVEEEGGVLTPIVTDAQGRLVVTAHLLSALGLTIDSLPNVVIGDPIPPGPYTIGNVRDAGWGGAKLHLHQVLTNLSTNPTDRWITNAPSAGMRQFITEISVSCAAQMALVIEEEGSPTVAFEKVFQPAYGGWDKPTWRIERQLSQANRRLKIRADHDGEVSVTVSWYEL